MGMLDGLSGLYQPGILGGGSDLFSNPLTFGALGALGAYADTLEPSRLPKSPVAGLLRGAAGFGQGYLNGQQATTLNSLKDVQLAQQASRLAMMQQYGLLPPGFKIPGAIGSMMGGGAQPAQTAPATGPAPMSGPAMSPGWTDPTSYQQAAGLGSPSPTGGAPSALAPPQAAASPTGMPFAPEAVRSALAAELIAPGAGAKQLPGPSDLSRLYQERAAIAAQNPSDPRLRGYDFATLKAQGIDPVMNMRPGNTASLIDPVTLQYRPGLQVPNLPEGMQAQYDQNGRATATEVPGVNDQVARLAAIQQGAIGRREMAVAGNTNRLEFGDLGVGGGGGGGGFPGYSPSLGTGRGRQPTAPQSTPADSTPIPITAPGAAQQGQTRPLQTESGTIIPPRSEQAPINRAGAYLKEALPDWAKTEASWNTSLGVNAVAQQRMLAIMDALKKTQSGTWATDAASVSAGLKSLGINIPDEILGNPAQVQIALKNNFGAALDQVKEFSSRGTQMEVAGAQKAFANPDLQPEANLSIGAGVIGRLRWESAMRNDWATAKAKLMWQNPNDFERAWIARNPIQPFIDQAKQEVGPLKGMQGGPGAKGTINWVIRNGKLVQE